MNGFFYICEYLEIEPRDFFDTAMKSPRKNMEPIEDISKLPEEKAEQVRMIIKDLAER